MKKIKIGLLARIIIAIILGIAIGTFFPAPLVRIFVTFNGIFSEFLHSVDYRRIGHCSYCRHR